MTGESVVCIIFSGGEAEPRIVHGEANLVWCGLEQFGVVLHHALESGRCLKLSPLSIGVLRVDELRDNATTGLKRLDVVWDLEDESVGVSGERGVALAVRNITLWIPLGLQKCVKLVVLDIDDGLITRVVLLHKPADGSHRLAWLSRYAD